MPIFSAARFLIVFALLALPFSRVGAQTKIYTPTINIPVTFYDYHSDGSNPEFEKDPGTGAGTHLGMVNATLGPNRKPTIGPTPYWSCDIAKWFVPWTPGDFTIPNYTNPVTTGCGNPFNVVNYDTAFINKVIPSTLAFQYVAGTPGTYTFNSQAFFPLDGLGFLADETNPAWRNHNFSFSMELHYQFTKVPGLVFQFAGDDDCWAFINNKLVMDIGGIHNTTNGILYVDSLHIPDLTQCTFDFFYCERHATGSDIEITTNLLSAVDSGINITQFPTGDTIPAGGNVVFTATVKTDFGTIDTASVKQFTWQLVPSVTTPISQSTLSITQGKTTTFNGITALYNPLNGALEPYLVIGTLPNPRNPSVPFRDTSLIYVKAGPATQLVIVRDTAITHLLSPIRLGLVSMDSATNLDTVFAVTYDAYNNYEGLGNFSGFATSALWTSRDTTSVKAKPAPGLAFEGVLQRNTKNPASTIVQASQTGLSPDSITVQLQSGFPIAIRLVNSAGVQITRDSMNTDHDTTLIVQVQWSNAPGVWVNGTGTWSITPSPDVITWKNPLPSGLVGSWTLSPQNPGNDNLTVTAGTQSVTIPLIITPAPPSSVTIQLANPNDSIIAGRPFKVVESIYNSDGLVPGSFCSPSATYSDSLGNGNKTAQPTVLINGVLTPVQLGQSSGECFNNGLDTVTVTLYNAPWSLDTNQKISLLLNNQTINLPIASTTPFHVYPGPLDSLALEDALQTPMPGPDTLNVASNNTLSIYSWGYDHYGNLIGKISSSWSETGNLIPLPSPTTNISSTFIDASSVILNENGIVTAQAPSGTKPDSMVSASLQLYIFATGANLSSAVTKDLNGNGILDQIWVTLNKPVSDTATANLQIPASNVSVVYTDPNTSAKTSLLVDSIKPVKAVNDAMDTTSSFIIYLHDVYASQNGILEPASAVPQTAWKPLVSIAGIVGANPISNKQCKDGAGPVVWSVTVNKSNPYNRSTDLVTVTFSEPIQDTDGTDFSINNVPGLVFNVWKKTDNGLVLDTTVLACDSSLCINGFIKPAVTNPSIVQFTMGNGRTVFDYDYFNIRVPFKVTDKASSAGPGNFPDTNNQRVLAQIIGNPIAMQVGPNPTHPTYSKPDPPSGYSNNSSYAVIDFINNPQAAIYARDHGGAVFRFTVSPGDSGQGRVTAYIKIYDVVGNLVNSAAKNGPNDNLVTEIKNLVGSGPQADTSASYNYDVYWDGVNAKGMKVATGVYQAFAYLTTYDHNGAIIAQSRQQAVLGMKR